MSDAPLAHAPLASDRPAAAGSMPARLTSLDAYRGFVMFLMMAEVLSLPQVASAGIALLVLGGLLHWTGVCPLVKRIWTPSFTLYSGGWCVLLLAGFYAVIDVWNCRRWAFPLVVIGMNSIAIYCMVELFQGSIIRMLRRHLGAGGFRVAGPAFEPVLLGAAAMLTLWLILYWMYRRKLFLKV